MPQQKKEERKNTAKGDTKKTDKKDKKNEPSKKRASGGGTVGYTVKAIRGQYYNIVESLDGLVCPPVSQVQMTGPSRAPREPPCCPPSTCCYPPPYCPQQPGRRCC